MFRYDSEEKVVESIKKVFQEISEDNPPLYTTVRALTSCQKDIDKFEIDYWKLGLTQQDWDDFVKDKARKFAQEVLDEAKEKEPEAREYSVRNATEVLARLGYTFDDLGKHDAYCKVMGQTPPKMAGALPQKPGLN